MHDGYRQTHSHSDTLFSMPADIVTDHPISPTASFSGRFALSSFSRLPEDVQGRIYEKALLEGELLEKGWLQPRIDEKVGFGKLMFRLAVNGVDIDQVRPAPLATPSARHHPSHANTPVYKDYRSAAAHDSIS